jgi:transcriptional regulator with XRE-family HTH domain
MDVCSVIKTRLEELGLEQKDLAAAAEVTESYISQLLTRKKLPPAPDRTDIYEKIDKALKLSNGELAKLALAQRMDALKRNYEEPRGALLKETRKLILRKCVAARQKDVRSIFERQPFGELEQLVKAMSKCVSLFWNSSIQISSVFQTKTAFLFWTR